jgi:hypothetical protein
MERGSDPAHIFEIFVAIENQYNGIGACRETGLVFIFFEVYLHDEAALLLASEPLGGIFKTDNDSVVGDKRQPSVRIPQELVLQVDLFKE